jgi:hypothetical protein
MTRGPLLAILVLLMVGPVYGQVGFFSYSEWASSDENSRAAYIAGAFDFYAISAMNAGPASQKAAERYSGCLQSARFTHRDLAEHVKTYAEAHPPSQRGPAVGALIDYLVALCGVEETR